MHWCNCRPENRHLLNTGMEAIADNYGPVEITLSVSTSIFLPDFAWVQKKNGIVSVFIYGKVLTKDIFILATLPAGLRPWATVRGNGSIIYNDTGNVTSSGAVKDNGQIQISGLQDKHISFSISYPAHH